MHPCGGLPVRLDSKSAGNYKSKGFGLFQSGGKVNTQQFTKLPRVIPGKK